MRRRLIEWLQYRREVGYVEVGPLVITTWERHAKSDWNAFQLGMDAGRQGWLKGSGPKF